MAPKKKKQVKKNAWTDEERLFSDKSKLINVDLHSYFANPKAWEVLTEADKAEIQALLPPHIALTDNDVLPQAFLRYDNDWRNALRQFQVDLQAGRYEDDWLNEAAQAMEERAAGDFDKFKEEEYEEFWGQKQKLRYDVLAGEMTTLKLEVLVDAGIFSVGDIWSYTRGFGRGRSKILVEKDVTISAIDGSKLTFSVPPGQSKYLVKDQSTLKDQPMARNTIAPSSGPFLKKLSSQEKVLHDKPKMSSFEANPLPEQRTTPPAKAMAKEPHRQSDLLEISLKRKSGDEHEDTISQKRVMRDQVRDECKVDCEEEQTATNTAAALTPTPYDTSKAFANDIEIRQDSLGENSVILNAEDYLAGILLNQYETHGSDGSREDHILPEMDPYAGPSTVTITYPQALENKILELDGRFTDYSAGNAWKAIRCKRDNQDMGSLWEMREEFYVHNTAL